MDEALHSSMEEDDSTLMDSRRIFRSLDDCSSGPSTSSGGRYTTEDHHVIRSRQRRILNTHMPLAKAKSTPLHLNQIFEERESDLDDSPRNSPQIERARRHIGAIKTRRSNRRLSPVPSTGSSRRSSSCSSSDDDDLDKHMKRLNTSSSCRRSPRHSYRKDDSGSEGDGGGVGGVGGGGIYTQGSLRSLETTSQQQNSGSNQDTQKQTDNGGKTCSLTLTLATVHENKLSLDAIEESNKENIKNNIMLGNSFDLTSTKRTTNKEIVKCRVNSAPLPAKIEVEQLSRSYSMQRKGSAVKYIHSFSELEKTLENNNDNLSAGKRDSLTPDDIDNISMNVETKRPRTINSDHIPVLRSPAVRSVTSTCCQIF